MEEQFVPLAAQGSGPAHSEADFARLYAQHQLLLTLFRVSAQLAAELGTRDLAPHAIRIIGSALPDIDIVGLWLYSRAERRLQLAAVHSGPEAPVFDPAVAAQLSLRLNEGVVGDVVATRQPVLLPDLVAYQRTLAALEPANAALIEPFAAQLPTSLRVVVLPLYLGDIPVGALELFDIGTGPIAAATDLPLLQAFADQLAVVFRNAQIYAEMSEQHRRLQAFDAVVTAITAASDMPQMLERVLSVTLYVVGAQGGAIALLRETTLQVEVNYQLPTELFGPGRVQGLAVPPVAEVLRSGQPQVELLADEHPWAMLRDGGVEAVALLPLLAGGTVVGVMLLALGGASSSRLDWPSLLAFGNQIGIAIANYQLYNASQRERRQLAGVIESIAEGVIICNRTGDLVLSNQAAELILGRELEPGITMAEFARLLAMRTLDGRLLAVDETPLGRSLHGDLYQNYEVIVTNRSGHDQVISCSGAPLVADNGALDGAVVVFRDMTAYKQHEALRDEFVAVAAHELRAPLAAIKGYTDLLVQRETQRPDATDRDRRGILMLSRQVEHLVRLVDNLLDVSRLDAGRLQLYLQPADLVALVESSIDRIRIGDNNHEFVFDGPPHLHIVCDQLRLQQVFTNLLSNAARYSPAGTRISVEVWTEAISDPHADQYMVVAVRDQGVGMMPDVQAKVFDRYYRANTVTAASGLGLGVYISREIVLRHGGQIWLESEPGVGTTFYVRLPAQATPSS
ncbi:MAG: histidine kinase [Chloroflexi bacterium]|nr:MAG: histidine kinase [Chloroflexota bacterium]